MLKILQARLSAVHEQELPDGFRKGRGTRDDIANIRWISVKLMLSSCGAGEDS